MNKQILMEFITKHCTIILAVSCPFCLFIGSSIATYTYTIIYLLLILMATPTYLLMLFMPTRLGMRMSICLNKGDQKDIDISVWDAYIKKYEGRYGHLYSWINLVVHLCILAMFMAAGIWFVVYIDIIYTVIGEAAGWRLYKTIRDNKIMWGAASFLVQIQEACKSLPTQKSGR